MESGVRHQELATTTPMMTTTARLQQWAEQRGYRVALGTTAVLDEVRALLEGLKHSGELDAEFARGNLEEFQFSEYAEIAGLATVILVAVPRPAHTVTFVVDGRELEAILPPTYHRYSAFPYEVRQDLMANALQSGAHVEVLMVPFKSVAAQLGLTQYGRNNVTYIPGFGSYFQLAAFATDADFGRDARDPVQPKPMPACGRCRRCQAACPTGAIGDGRFLLHAERCLTLFSENSGKFPAESFSAGNRCLVGCLDCQQACPVNRGRLRLEPTGVRFSAEETAAIINSGDCRSGELWDSIRAKLRRLVLFDCEAILGRNLRALIARSSG